MESSHSFLKLPELFQCTKKEIHLQLIIIVPSPCLAFSQKFFEKLMSRRLNSFLPFSDILVSHQFGILENMSTSVAVLEFLDDCYDSINSNKFLI